jgi:hypothetical protein
MLIHILYTLKIITYKTDFTCFCAGVKLGLPFKGTETEGIFMKGSAYSGLRKRK